MTKISLHRGDNRDSLRRLIEQGVRVHSVVTDPPYGLVSIQKRFGKEGSKNAKVEGTDGSFARLSGGFMGKCFHPDTDVMTDCGWRRVTDIRIGDRVATLNPETRDTEWQSVAQTHAYPFAGSGTTAEAARREGFDCILMEAESEYIEFLESRFNLRRSTDLTDLLS